MSPVEKLFASMQRLPSIPKVVQELIASLCKEDVDIGSLVAQVKQDQALAARVLQMANSSAYGASQKIGSIDHAVTMIGLSALRSIVIASGMSRAFSGVEGMNMKSFWRHSMVTAGVARVIGKREGINPEFAYTAGLMHRLGQLLICLAYPAAARQITRDGGPTGAALLTIERSLFDTDHCQVGAELARRWQFPVEIQNGLRWYLAPLASEATPLAAVVNLAAEIAQGLEVGDAPALIAAELPRDLIALLGLEEKDVQWRIESCKDLPAQSEALL